MKEKVYLKIDEIIVNINKFKNEPKFTNEVNLRKKRKVSESYTNNEIIKIFIELIAYSQNSNSKLVEEIIDSGIFKEIFAGFDINEIVKMNPCDLADKYWVKIKGIRQQTKLFQIVTLARKINKIGAFNKILTETDIPKKINTKDDVEQFWKGFKKLKKIMTENKIPFFRSTTSLLHLLLTLGYDCVKPDLVVMKVAKKIGIVDKVTGEKNLIKTVRTVQEYSVVKNIRPAVVDLYFLIDEGQRSAIKFVDDNFYK